MQRAKISLPKDELPHLNQAIEWWYFNGFLQGKKRYAYMSCLFKADKDKVNLSFLKIPTKTIYFSHTILYDLTKKSLQKEILPFVIPSEDSFENRLAIDYFYPLKRTYRNYSIARIEDKIRIKSPFFDLLLKENKKPLLENQTGHIDLGSKSTYYYSYTDLKTSGFIGEEKVVGKSWHDKQWSGEGFMHDSWLWFSLQLESGIDIVCFDYKGKKLASLIYPNNKQETCEVEFKPLGKTWKSKLNVEYELEWEIKIKNFIIRTRPIIPECEMNFGFVNYWEGPLNLSVNGKESKNSFGFMEYLSKTQEASLRNTISNTINLAFDYEKNKNKLLSRIYSKNKKL